MRGKQAPPPPLKKKTTQPPQKTIKPVMNTIMSLVCAELNAGPTPTAALPRAMLVYHCFGAQLDRCQQGGGFLRQL